MILVIWTLICASAAASETSHDVLPEVVLKFNLLTPDVLDEKRTVPITTHVPLSNVTDVIAVPVDVLIDTADALLAVSFVPMVEFAAEIAFCTNAVVAMRVELSVAEETVVDFGDPVKVGDAMLAFAVKVVMIFASNALKFTISAITQLPRFPILLKLLRLSNRQTQ